MERNEIQVNKINSYSACIYLYISCYGLLFCIHHQHHPPLPTLPFLAHPVPYNFLGGCFNSALFSVFHHSNSISIHRHRALPVIGSRSVLYRGILTLYSLILSIRILIEVKWLTLGHINNHRAEIRIPAFDKAGADLTLRMPSEHYGGNCTSQLKLSFIWK